MDAIEILTAEHQHILRGLDLLNKVSERYDKGEILSQSVDDLVIFFRQYADVGHHQKEEDLLFSALYDKNPSLKGEYSPITELNQQHVEGRRLVGEISKKDTKFPFFVQDYNSLINRHIQIEDTLFPELADTNFTSQELQKLTMQFLEVEENTDTNALLKLLETVSFTL